MKPATFLRVALIGALAWLAIRHVDPQALLHQFDQRMLLAALLVQPLVASWIVLTAWRHGRLVAPPAVALRHTVPSVLLAVGLNAVLPARASEILKVTYLAEKAGLPLGRCAGAVLLERIADVLLIGLMGVVALALLQFDLSPTVIALAVVVPVSALLLLGVAARRLGACALPPSLRFLHGLTGALRTVADRLNGPGLVLVFGGGLLIWTNALLTVSLFLVTAGLGHLTWLQLLSVFVVTTLASAIPALPGGVGTYQAAGVLVLGQYGVGVEQALALTAGVQLAVYALPLLLSFWIVSRHGAGLRSLWRRARSG